MTPLKYFSNWFSPEDIFGDASEVRVLIWAGAEQDLERVEGGLGIPKRFLAQMVIILLIIIINIIIQLLESPIPTTPTSQNISGTKRGSIDPLVSNRPEKILKKRW